ncbi:MAG: radical SAM protein [Armatimonadota bacterium]|nr:radical SAM protein [Armatimonadota bacterium]
MEGILVATYRCNARCHMCNTWQFPTSPEQEMDPKYYERFPRLKFLNITGGEPFLREDLEEIVNIVKPKCDRICISTNGYFTDRIVALAKKFKGDIGIRISIEGLPAANDELRGIKDGFDHGLRTLLQLKRMGMKDIGFGITVSDRNAKDLLELYELAKHLKVEFATAIVHNSYYFHKFDNEITKKEEITESFTELIRELFKTKRLKNWYRAYFNHGIINYVNGGKRLLPCNMGTDVFLCEPWGDIKPCNVLDEVMGNIKEQTFEEIWASPRAEEVRKMARNCRKRCWMIGSVAPEIKKRKWYVLKWILKNKWNYKPCFDD